jgi:hypothetical protein
VTPDDADAADDADDGDAIGPDGGGTTATTATSGTPSSRPTTLNEVARRLDAPTTGDGGEANRLAGAEPVGGPDQ